MLKKYDYLIVGAGLYGAMFSYFAAQKGKRSLVLEKKNHIGGFCYTDNINGIDVHKYGAHIFHTNSKNVWDFVNRICEFSSFVNSPIANYCGRIFNLPFNMNTFYQMWGVTTPKDAIERINKTAVPNASPKNLEEYIISQIGTELYEVLVKGYTEKQWGKKCSELPPHVMMGRIPIRFTYNNNYYNDRYQGIPYCGYTEFIRRLLSASEVCVNTDFFSDVELYMRLAKRVVYTGAIDEFYEYTFGKLGYRSVCFKQIILDDDNYQGNAVVNYTDTSPYTRVIEHKHFNPSPCRCTVVSFEYPTDYSITNPPSYPVHTEENIAKYIKYKSLADKEKNVIFGGRLAEYKYYNMNDIIEQFI